jgi:hypothetical protein
MGHELPEDLKQDFMSYGPPPRARWRPPAPGTAAALGDRGRSPLGSAADTRRGGAGRLPVGARHPVIPVRPEPTSAQSRATLPARPRPSAGMARLTLSPDKSPSMRASSCDWCPRGLRMTFSVLKGAGGECCAAAPVFEATLVRGRYLAGPLGALAVAASDTPFAGRREGGQACTTRRAYEFVEGDATPVNRVCSDRRGRPVESTCVSPFRRPVQGGASFTVADRRGDNPGTDVGVR